MNNHRLTFDEIVSYAKRNGFVYPSSEIYDGLAGVYDYGPRGVELATNVKNEWWKEIVRRRKDTVGLDASIFMNPRVWEASGHVANFSDPLTECKDCHARFRADTALEEIGVSADDKMSLAEINEVFETYKSSVSCPSCKGGNFTEVKHFNLLVASNLGNIAGDARSPVWLRGETCQGIYVDYLNVLNTTRTKVPFGIAQIGKAFRNEITARQFIFRTREFEQMENQRFVPPEREMEEYDQLRQERMAYYTKRLGFSLSNLRWREHEKLAFYANAAWDIEFQYPFGFAELEGVHARGSYDLSQHSRFSGKDLSYTDSDARRYIPHVIESSVGVGRTVLAAISDALTKERLVDGSERVLLKIHPNLAPVKVAVFPLVKNKPDIIAYADGIFESLAEQYSTEWDDNGNIGKRYRRQDEIGTPFCVTVDYQSLEDGSVTVRDRDTMLQTRVSSAKLAHYIQEQLKTPYRK